MKNLRIDETNRTKVFLEDRHVKTIPNKYSRVLKKKHIINPKRKRLTREERFKLEVALLEENLKSSHIYHLIKRSTPAFVREVTTPYDQYYELVYKNRMGVKIGIDIYRLCPDKESIKRNF